MEVCELDENVVEIAEKWFGFQADSLRMSVHVGDGVDFVRNRETTQEQGKTCSPPCAIFIIGFSPSMLHYRTKIFNISL